MKQDEDGFHPDDPKSMGRRSSWSSCIPETFENSRMLETVRETPGMNFHGRVYSGADDGKLKASRLLVFCIVPVMSRRLAFSNLQANAHASLKLCERKSANVQMYMCFFGTPIVYPCAKKKCGWQGSRRLARRDARFSMVVRIA